MMMRNLIFNKFEYLRSEHYMSASLEKARGFVSTNLNKFNILLFYKLICYVFVQQ